MKELTKAAGVKGNGTEPKKESIESALKRANNLLLVHLTVGGRSKRRGGKNQDFYRFRKMFSVGATPPKRAGHPGVEPRGGYGGSEQCGGAGGRGGGGGGGGGGGPLWVETARN